MVASLNEENIMPYVKQSDKTTEKLRGWLIVNPNKPRKKLDERSTPIPEKKNPESAATGETP